MTFFGLQLHPQYTTWDEMREAALQRAMAYSAAGTSHG